MAPLLFPQEQPRMKVTLLLLLLVLVVPSDGGPGDPNAARQCLETGSVSIQKPGKEKERTSRKSLVDQLAWLSALPPPSVWTPSYTLPNCYPQALHY